MIRITDLIDGTGVRDFPEQVEVIRIQHLPEVPVIDIELARFRDGEGDTDARTQTQLSFRSGCFQDVIDFVHSEQRREGSRIRTEDVPIAAWIEVVHSEAKVGDHAPKFELCLAEDCALSGSS